MGETAETTAETGTWWIIPLSKYVITLVISELTLLIPLKLGDITYLRFVG